MADASAHQSLMLSIKDPMSLYMITPGHFSLARRCPRGLLSMYVIDWHFDPASSIAIAPALSPPQIATCRRASSCGVFGGAGPELSGAKTQTGSSVIGTSCGSFPAWTCVALPATPGSARRTGLCILSSHKSVVIFRAIRNGDCAIGADVSEELAEDRLRLTADGLGSDASAWSCVDRAAVRWGVLP